MKKFTEIAMPYVEMGWKVFPIRYGTKSGYFAKGLMPHLPRGSFYWGTDDLAQIERFERDLPGGPRHNIAARTGLASDIVVIDLDFGKGPEAQRGLEALAAQGKTFPYTPAVAVTPTGGQHWYYRYRGKLSCSSSKLGKNIDIRADGGLIILPPSLRLDKGGARYEWESAPFGETLPILPKWAMDDLMPKPTPRSSFRPRVNPRGTNKDASLYQWRLEELANAPEGDRNGTLYRLYRGCLRRGHAPAEVSKDFESAALSAGLTWKEIVATMRSVEDGLAREGML